MATSLMEMAAITIAGKRLAGAAMVDASIGMITAHPHAAMASLQTENNAMTETLLAEMVVHPVAKLRVGGLARQQEHHATLCVETES